MPKNSRPGSSTSGQAAQLASDAICGSLDAIQPIQTYAAVKLDEDQLQLYATELADIPADQLRRGVRHYLRTAGDRFFPTIRRIRESVDAACGVQIDGWEVAFSKVMDAARKWSRFDADRAAEAWNSLTPEQAEAVRFLGGFDAISGTDAPILRAHFRDWWNGRAKQAATERAVERKPIGLPGAAELAKRLTAER